MQKRSLSQEPDSQFLEQVWDAIQKSKGYASFWDWPDRRTKECGIVCDLLEAIENKTGPQEIRRVRANKPDPPDCIGTTASGERVAIEVTELVDQRTVELNQAGNRVLKEWSPHELRTKLQEIITAKDSKRFHGGPYSKTVLVIHTDEPLLSHMSCVGVLRRKKFTTCKSITDAYLIFSGACERGFYPFIRLETVPLFDLK